MKYIDEYRNSGLINKYLDSINKLTTERVNLMEVCGTHTVSFFRSGLRNLLPDKIRLISGPGCPVCVTPNSYIDKAIAYSKLKNVVITTFGDMFRVPGTDSSLEREKALGADIRIIYSPMESLDIAQKEKNKKVIFLGVGFETTIPAVAVSIIEAKKKKLRNYFVFCGHKVIPGALRALVDDREVNVQGFILPGHVSAIIGSRPYGFLAREYGIPSVITGFEPLDVTQGIYMLIKQLNEKRADVEIQYRRGVKEEGNPKAVKLMNEVFGVESSIWRGIGVINDSGLRIKEKYKEFDAQENIAVRFKESHKAESHGCICGKVIKGIKVPTDCKLFGRACKPENPVGACMVSSEGTCSAYYKYNESNAKF